MNLTVKLSSTHPPMNHTQINSESKIEGNVDWIQICNEKEKKHINNSKLYLKECYISFSLSNCVSMLNVYPIY